jgi:hypothetical protein
MCRAWSFLTSSRLSAVTAAAVPHGYACSFWQLSNAACAGAGAGAGAAVLVVAAWLDCA